MCVRVCDGVFLFETKTKGSRLTDRLMTSAAAAALRTRSNVTEKKETEMYLQDTFGN